MTTMMMWSLCCCCCHHPCPTLFVTPILIALPSPHLLAHPTWQWWQWCDYHNGMVIALLLLLLLSAILALFVAPILIALSSPHPLTLSYMMAMMMTMTWLPQWHSCCVVIGCPCPSPSLIGILPSPHPLTSSWLTAMMTMWLPWWCGYHVVVVALFVTPTLVALSHMTVMTMMWPLWWHGHHIVVTSPCHIPLGIPIVGIDLCACVQYLWTLRPVGWWVQVGAVVPMGLHMLVPSQLTQAIYIYRCKHRKIIGSAGAPAVRDVRAVLISPNSKVILSQMGNTHKETDVLLDWDSKEGTEGNEQVLL